MTRFCPNLRNEDVKKDFDELVQTFGENTAYYLFDKNHGNTLNYTPNGAVSEVFNQLVDYYEGDRSQALRTKANGLTPHFIEQFGDWTETDKEPSMEQLIGGNSNKDIVNKVKFMQDVANLRDEAQTALRQGITVAEFNDLHKTNFSYKDGRVTINLNPMLNGIHLDTDLSQDKLVYNNTRNHITHQEFIQLLQRKFNLKYKELTAEQYRSINTDPTSNCCVIGNTVYVKANGNNLTNEQLAEEFLHPAINKIHQTNKHLFSNLVSQAKKDFPGLWKSIQDQYKDGNREEELVAHVLSKYYHREIVDNGFNSRKMVNAIKMFVQRVKQLFTDMFGEFNRPQSSVKISGSDISDIYDNITFDKLAQLFNIEDTYFQDELGQGEVMDNKDYEPVYAGDPAVLIQDSKEAFKQLVQELKHRVDQPLQAIETAESLYIDIQNQDELTSADKILNFIEKQASQVNNDVVDKHVALNATRLVQLKTDFLGTYMGILNKMREYANLTNNNDIKSRIGDLGKLISPIDDYYKEQLQNYASTFVDNYIKEHVHEGNIEAFRTTAKDWLLRQEMYGDISAIERWGGMFENSRSPILRIAFNMISNANKRVMDQTLDRSTDLVKAYKKAFSTVERSIPGSRQQIFLERDANGRFTGNFISKVNNGMYQQDKANFIKDLKNKYVKEYGATIDDHGNIYFKDDDESVWDENGNWVKPTRYKFEDEITNWQKGKSHRQFTAKYYLERHTKPYREYYVNGRRVIENGHGLSPFTEAKERDIQQQITNLENMCEQDGYFATWKLSPRNRSKLERLRAEKENLSSIFNQDGTPKTGDDLTIAQELTAWKSYLKDKIPYKTDKQLYAEDYQKIVDKYGIDSKEVGLFLRYNSRYGINSDFMNALINKFGAGNTSDELNRRKSVIQQYKKMLMRSTDPSSIDFTSVEGNPDFWAQVSDAERDVEHAKEDIEQTKKDESFFDYVEFKDVPHYENGSIMYRVIDGKRTDQYQSEIDWLLDYTMALYTNDERYNSLRNNHGINEHQMYIDQAKEAWLMHQREMGIPANLAGEPTPDFIKRTFYETQYFAVKDGEYRPLSIFKYMSPKGDVQDIDGVKYQTKDWNPGGKYKSVDMNIRSPFVDPAYKQEVGGEQADEHKYDNTKAYNKAVDTKEKEELLNLLKTTMQEARNAIPYIKDNRNTDVQRAPQVYASTMANISRTNLSSLFKKLGYFWSRLSKVDDNTQYINNMELVTRPDGSIVHNIPIRFLKCEHPESISSDLVSSVSMFYNMAMNFKQKSAIENDLLILQHTLALRNDQVNNSTNSVNALENLIQGNLYGNQSVIRKPHARDKKSYQWDKRLVKYINSARRYSSFRMLAWNTTSAFVGALSSSTIIARDAYVGKYITGKDLGKASLYFAKYIAPLIMNMGDPIAHNKLTAMMQKMQLSKQNNEIFKTSRSKLLRFIGEHWAMGGYTIGDYCNNSIQLLAYSNNARLYDGDIIPKGFYTRGQMIDNLMRTGLTRKQAIHEYNNTRYSMYDAYGYKDNKIFVKPGFEQYLTDNVDADLFNRVKSRTALANGLMDNQEMSAINNNIFGKFLVSMRKFAIQFLYAAWAGGNDYIPVEVEKDINGRYFHKPLTADQKREKGYYDFETGETTRGYVRQSMYGVFNHGLPAIWHRIINLNKEHKLDTKGMTQDEKYATRTFVFTIGSILAATAISAVLKNLVDGMTPLDDEIPFSVLMMDTGNMPLQDILQNQYNQLQQQPLELRAEKAKQIYLRLLYLSYVREVNENLTTIDPRTYSDFITSATTFLSTSNKFEAAAADVVLGMANPDYYDKTVNNGPYKGWRSWKRDIVRLSPLDNMITNHTDRGLKSKTKFYYNLNQVLFEMAGMNQPAPNKGGGVEKDPFGGDNFGSNNFGGDNFGSDNFN